MFNLAEKEVAISEAITISDLVKDHLPDDEAERVPLLLKALANYIERTSAQNPSDLLQEVERALTERNPHRALQRMLIHMVTVGTTEDPLTNRMYSTGDVARFFGVSLATVNNWLQQGRIIGFEKGARFKQARIPETSIYVSTTGERLTIQEVSERYEADQARFNRQVPMTPAEELAEMLEVVIHYEKKYGGEYKHTLARKSDLNPEEERDAHEWGHLLRAVEEHIGQVSQ